MSVLPEGNSFGKREKDSGQGAAITDGHHGCSLSASEDSFDETDVSFSWQRHSSAPATQEPARLVLPLPKVGGNPFGTCTTRSGKQRSRDRSSSHDSWDDSGTAREWQRSCTEPATQEPIGAGFSRLGNSFHNNQAPLEANVSSKDGDPNASRLTSSDSFGDINDLGWTRQQSAPAGKDTQRGRADGGYRSPQSRILARRFGRKSLQIDVSGSTSSTKSASTHMLLSAASSLSPCKATSRRAPQILRPTLFPALVGEEPVSAGGTRLSDVYEEAVELLGRGAFGVVKAGRRKEDDKQVALKMQLTSDEEKQEASKKEWDVLSSLSHPNVVTACGLYCNQKAIVLVVERVPGESLMKVMAESSSGILSEGSSWHLGKCLLEAVAYLHSKRIVHRDIKSSNVMVQLEKLMLKIIDFNCSRFLPEKDEDPYTPFSGTKRWAAPEVLREKVTSVSFAYDVWAVGLIHHLMLVGALPNANFGVKNNVQLKELDCVNVSHACKEVVRLCLEVDASKRPSAAQLLSEPWLQGVCPCTEP